MGDAVTQFIARQAIFDRQQRSYGYELLYRDGPIQQACHVDQESATRSTISKSFLFGLDTFCGDSRAFVNCTAAILTSDYILTTPPARTVLEVLETVEASEAVISGLQRLKQAGFTIALDDFVPDRARLALLGFADLLKIDVQATSSREVEELVRQFRGTHKLLAEKVETREEFSTAFDLGFELFQGYFFQKPEILQTNDLSANVAVYAQLIAAVNNTALDFNRLETLIKSDAALCYRLLRYLNSALFCLQSSVTSIRHALALLGEREIRKWISLVALTCAAQSRPHELLKSALLRAKLGGALAPRARCREYDGFLLGMFSLMDCVLGVPMQQIICKVEMPPEVAVSLKGKTGRLTQLMEMIKNYETGEWAQFSSLASQLGIEERYVAGSYSDSIRWVDQLVALT